MKYCYTRLLYSLSEAEHTAVGDASARLHALELGFMGVALVE